MKKVTIALVKEAFGSFELEEAELSAPNENEVLVKIVATGICHTDVAIKNQVLPCPLPLVLGHEGAGIVEAVGSKVNKVVPGDHVVISFSYCGSCPNCRNNKPAYCHHFLQYNFSCCRPDGSGTLHQNEQIVYGSFFGQSSFSSHVLAGQNNVIKVPKEIPLEILAPLGCSIQTGAGSVINSLRCTAGKSIAIFGTGAVGLSAVMAAKAIGCPVIIAIDINEARLQAAEKSGATHMINSSNTDPSERIQAITDGIGLDFSLDTTGKPDVINTAIAALNVCGTCGLTAIPKPGTRLDIDPMLIGAGRCIKGIVEGNSIPDVFIPYLIKQYQLGCFPYAELISFYSFNEINKAVADLEKGQVIKPVIQMGA
jgi:aryl-alcohol dehydrogenase